MNVIKRNGQEVVFDLGKIKAAIAKANKDVAPTDRIDSLGIINIATAVNDECENLKRAVNVEEIQDFVEDTLLEMGYYRLAKAYMTYRYQHALMRQTNTTDGKILSLINLENEEIKQENSNKNPVIVSTQRDYMAGEVSKDLSKRYLLPPDIIEAHNKGIIHFHDMDYFAQHIHNCLDRSTQFITDKGVKSFYDFNDGDETCVLTKDGHWKKAIVKCYGRDKLFRYTFYSGKKSITHEVLATENHRWYLKDGSITTNLKVGDKLVKAPIIYQQDSDYETFDDYQKLLWCKGFGLGDGTVEFNGANKHINSTRIRLCGKKDNQWLERFNIDGCTIRKQCIDGDHIVAIKDYHKEIPYFRDPLDIRAFMNGLYCADGKMAINNPHSRVYRIQSSKKEVIDFIRTYAPVAGLYITRENDLTGEATNFTDARPYTILFSFNPNFAFAQTVLKKEFVKEDEVWCLEVEDEHNFVLANGIVTGNCDLINLEDMLQNGTIISGTLIEKPHSFATACNIATQIVAQVASCQYGGQTFTMSHLAPFVDISRQKIKQEVEKEFKEIYKLEDIDQEKVNEIVESRVKTEIKRGIQTIQYQINTLMTTNG